MSAANVTATGVLAELDDYAKQEIRIAAVLNGGVSLAVWISGVVLELHHVALSSQGLGSWRPYRQVLDLLGPFVAAHPNTKVRHVEEFARCTLPNGDRHRAGFVSYTSNGVVVVWKQGFLWRGNGQYVLDKPAAVSSDWDSTGLTARLTDGSVLRIDWLAGSPERVGAEAAFDTFKPLPR